MKVASTVYDADVNYHWQNANDRVSYQREFFTGTYEQRLCAQALMTANPETPNEEISANLDNPYVPDRFGYDDNQITIHDILDGPLAESRSHVADYHTTDFSGKVSGRDGSEVNSLPLW
jgi:hypothetical protein